MGKLSKMDIRTEMKDQIHARLEKLKIDADDFHIHTRPYSYNLDEMRQDNLFLDITLKCGTTEVNCHKFVLALTIPYFREAFKAKQDEDNLMLEVKKHIDFETFYLLIDYAYTGAIKINLLNVFKVLLGAKLFKLQLLVDDCVKFMIRRISVENFLEIRKFAESHRIKKVFDAIAIFMDIHFDAVINSTNFLKLNQAEMFSILSQDKKNMYSNETVFRGIMNWCKKDENGIYKQLPKLLKSFRNENLTNNCNTLNDELRDATIPQQNTCSGSSSLNPETPSFHVPHKVCQEMAHNISNFQQLPPTSYVNGSNGFKEYSNTFVGPNLHYTKPFYSIPVLPALPTSVLPALPTPLKPSIFVLGGEGDLVVNFKTVEQFDPISNCWVIREDLDVSRKNHSVANVDGKLYVLGGYVSNEVEDNLSSCLERVDVLDFKDGGHFLASPMNMKKSFLASTVLHDLIYVCGGFNGLSPSHVIECFDPLYDTWKNVKKMSISRSELCVVSLLGGIYAIGGSNGTDVLDSVELYNPKGGNWGLISPMKTKRASFGALVFENKIYVCGGSDGNNVLSSLEVYDVFNNIWTVASEMKDKRKGCAFVEYEAILYAIGGCNETMYLDSVEAYDPKSDTWSSSSPLNIPRAFFGAAVV